MSHYQPGSDGNHFLGRCLECDAHYMKGMTLGQAESWYRRGVLSQAQWEAYTHVWATSAVRFGDYRSWEQPPEDPEVRQIVELLRQTFCRSE